MSSLLALSACNGDDGAAPPEAETPGTATSGAGDPGTGCPIVSMALIGEFLEVPEPELLDADESGCLFSVDSPDAPLGSVVVLDGDYGRELLEQFDSYDDGGLEAFGVRRLEDIDDAEGTYSGIGFTMVVDDRTIQFALDGTEIDRSDGIVALARHLAATER